MANERRIAQGYRVGNFKPSPETMDAFREVLLAAGIQTPAENDPDAGKRLEIYFSGTNQ